MIMEGGKDGREFLAGGQHGSKDLQSAERLQYLLMSLR